MLFSACVKELEINQQVTNDILVANCLFNPDENWELSIFKAKNLDESEDQPVENAKVEIHTGSDEFIVLDYYGKGKYTWSDNSFKEGVWENGNLKE